MGRCHAVVDVTPDELRDASYVMLNPTSIPRHLITKDVRTRVIGMSADKERTRIVVARGFDRGVTSGTLHLVAPDGTEGHEIKIESVTARQAFAVVYDTPDHVQRHSNVVLHPKSAAQTSPIQRRASGDASAADVQATAQAGVAGATERLPHFDTIQRAFGKHDISGVRAQVGGAATGAATALGAQAYATGDRVAFARAPDVHTAAHEAAHVVQQRNGVVGFQGLGAADDEHERHADEVADMVVAGKSAEAVLDKAAGSSPGATPVGELKHTIQRRVAHPLDRDAKPVNAEALGAKEIPIYEHERPHRLDGEVAVAVILRRIYEKTHLDAALQGDARSQNAIVAADEASELVKEIIQLTSLDKNKVDWKNVDTELVHALRGMHRVEVVAPALEKKRIGAAIAALERIV